MIRRTGEQAIRRLANNDEWSLRRVTNEVKSLAAKTCTINWVNCRNSVVDNRIYGVHRSDAQVLAQVYSDGIQYDHTSSN